MGVTQIGFAAGTSVPKRVLLFGLMAGAGILGGLNWNTALSIAALVSSKIEWPLRAASTAGSYSNAPSSSTRCARR